MTAAKAGQIVVTSSILGLEARGGMGLYCASKFALQGLVGSLRQELAGTGVKAATVNPGAVDTAWWTDPARGAKAAGAPPGMPMLAAEDVAAAIVAIIQQGAASDVDKTVLLPATPVAPAA